MFRELTGGVTFDLLRKGLDVSALRNKVIANNIANVNTPKFKRQIVSFEEEMQKVIDHKVDLVGQRTDDRHIPIDEIAWREVNPRTITDRAHIMRNDKNNVDIDVEMSDLAKNTMTFQIAGQRLSAMFSDLNDVITRAARS